MDPYDVPSSTNISPDCLALWDESSFAETFLEEMSEHENALNLDDMCEGSAHMVSDDWAHFSDLKFTNQTPPLVQGSFRVEFRAERPSGCKDHPEKFNVDGRLFFKLDLQTGEVVFDQPQTYRDYGHE